MGTLKYKIGDLVVAAQGGQLQAIAHCCNCFHAMGAGIAPLIKKAFPEAYVADLSTVCASKEKLGTFSMANVTIGSGSDLLIYNLYGQYGTGGRKEGKRDLNYNALYDALSAMAYHLPYNTLVGIPLIGAGLANGNWNIIEIIVKETLVKLGHDVVVYVLDEQTLNKVKGNK